MPKTTLLVVSDVHIAMDVRSTVLRLLAVHRLHSAVLPTPPAIGAHVDSGTAPLVVSMIHGCSFIFLCTVNMVVLAGESFLVSLGKKCVGIS